MLLPKSFLPTELNFQTKEVKIVSTIEKILNRVWIEPETRPIFTVNKIQQTDMAICIRFVENFYEWKQT